MSRRAVVEALHRDPAISRAEVLAEREMVRMGGEQVDGVLSSLGDFDLGADRVRLQIDANGDAQVLVAKHRRAAEVDERVGSLEDL